MRVYLSYTTTNTEQLATDLAEGLTSQGVQLRTAKDFKAGESWEPAAEREMNAADAYVIMVGTGLDRSRWQDSELTTAAEVSWTQPDKRIIPVLVGGAATQASSWVAITSSWC